MLPANYIDCVQGSGDWLRIRLGMLTSCRIADAVARRQKGDAELACRRRLRSELVCERLTLRASEHYISKWMEDGIENEPLARAAYEMALGVDVEQIGFVYHPTIKWAGASPDGLVGNDGMSEFKCPKLTTHYEYIDSGKVPKEYVDQIMWQLACCERQWCDFVSYCPTMPKAERLFIFRIQRVPRRIKEMEEAAEALLAEVEFKVADIKAKNKIFLTDGLTETLEQSIAAKRKDIPLDLEAYQ